MLSLQQRKELLALARTSISSHFEQIRVVLPEDEAFIPKKGVFVSLHKGEELRGCIGYIKGYKSLAASVVEMAQAAAFSDPRFPSLIKEELPRLTIEISVLDELLPMQAGELPEIGKDGLYISHPHGSGLLLPQVAVEWHWNAETFMKEVCRKAGLSSVAYMDPLSKIYKFAAEVFSEADTF
ncbi:MAG: AmmeMemoRadiSam system protein A [Candidatus Cloacimonetes bacterium]|nr:AmmeMemoRadiSam system protein A [Candidatus Cloacimonadota bacterium]